MTLGAFDELLRSLLRDRGWSQNRLAAVVVIDKGAVSRYVRGVRAPSEDFAVRCDQALSAHGELLAALHADRARSRGLSNSDSPTQIPIWANGRFAYVDIVPPSESVNDLVDGRRVAILNPIEHFSRSRKLLAESDNMFGPRRLVPIALDQVNLIQATRREFRNGQPESWFRMQAEFADLLGWFHQDMDDVVSAEFWLGKALQWANISGDTDSIAFILARMSQLAGDMKDGEAAVGFAKSALKVAKHNPRLSAIAATYGAYGYALDGDSHSSERAYDAAQNFLAVASADDECPWGEFFDDAYIRVHRAQSRLLIGQHKQAVDDYGTVLGVLASDYRRDQGVYLARGALAYAASRELEKAATFGLQALSIGADTGSRRTLGQLVELYQLLKPIEGNPQVQQFFEAMASVLKTRETR